MLSTVDELTRAGRRGFFEEQFPREVERAVRLRRPLALVMCDIDHFKLVNDRHGHQVGDEVLKEFTSRISSNLRMGKDWVARLGGEEFAVVFPDTGAKEAGLVARPATRAHRYRPVRRPPRPIAITASFGVCALEHPGRGSLHGLAAPDGARGRCGPVSEQTSWPRPGHGLQPFFQRRPTRQFRLRGRHCVGRAQRGGDWRESGASLFLLSLGHGCKTGL